MTDPNLQVHALIDRLSPDELDAVRSLLRVMVSDANGLPLSRSLAEAPVEEEEITPETVASIDRARASLAAGEGVSHEDILREFDVH